MAPPVQEPNATASRRFHVPHASSKRFVIDPSVHWLEAKTSSQSSCRRGWSRGSNPMAKRSNMGGQPSAGGARARPGRAAYAARVRTGVVIPVRGFPRYLGETLDAVLAQDPGEVVVVDDASFE